MSIRISSIRDKQKLIAEKWKKWNDQEVARAVPSGFKRLEDHVFCLEHAITHDNNLTAHEMASYDCWCEPANHQSIYVEKDSAS